MLQLAPTGPVAHSGTYSGHLLSVLAALATLEELSQPGLYDQINADGPVKTVVSSWFWVGNLRLVDADLIVLDDEIPDFARLIREPAVLVLADDREPPSEVFEEMAKAGYVMDTVHRRVEVPQALGFPPHQVIITRLHKKATP